MKNQNKSQRHLGAFSDACYGIAKTMLGSGAFSVTIKAVLAPDFTGLHLAAALIVLSLGLFFLLLGLLAED